MCNHSSDYLKEFSIHENDATLFNLLEIAALWCGVKFEDLANCIDDIQLEYGDEFYHPVIPGIRYAMRALITAIKNKELNPNNYEDCYDVDMNGHAYYYFRNMMLERGAVASWLVRKYPNNIPPFFAKPKQPDNVNTHPKAPLRNEYKPRYSTPELEVAIEAAKQIWDSVEEGVRPPKQIETKEIISEIYLKRTGVAPENSAVNRIDALIRPPAFKNHGKKEKS